MVMKLLQLLLRILVRYFHFDLFLSHLHYNNSQKHYYHFVKFSIQLVIILIYKSYFLSLQFKIIINSLVSNQHLDLINHKEIITMILYTYF